MTWEQFNSALPNLVSSTQREFLWQKVEDGEASPEKMLSNIWHHATLDKPKYVVFNGKMTHEEFMKALPYHLYPPNPGFRESLWNSTETGENTVAEMLHLAWWKTALMMGQSPKTDFKSKSNEPESTAEAKVDKSSDDNCDSDEFWELEFSHQAYVRNMREAQKKGKS